MNSARNRNRKENGDPSGHEGVHLRRTIQHLLSSFLWSVIVLLQYSLNRDYQAVERNAPLLCSFKKKGRGEIINVYQKLKILGPGEEEGKDWSGGMQGSQW